MTTGEITTEIEERAQGRVARVTVDNAGRANCLSSHLVEGLRDAFRDLAGDDGLRLAVLTGAGERSFMAGADLEELRDFNSESARAYITTLTQANTAIRDLPVIARINGACFGAGLEVAASCDIRIASAGARLGMPEVLFDLPSVVEAALFPRLIGWGRTAWLLYRGDAIDATMALAWGMVEKVVPLAELDAAVEETVATIAANGPAGIRLQKKLMRDWERLPIEDGIRAGVEALASAFEVGEPGKRIQAYFDAKG
ncbi:MAG: enoyl-CoA hydratase-related protein [Alphaproteobacteria bacterium]|jgi:enoyl-CoA hydratase/carnithine racemase|nr:enoyl-CoA hydratase-related protein [Alphaproteobacteria bacterium]MDP6603056.1 enoyl-CoA hydratase-related protein [Rhodospirillales bacterium]